ncbi:MAG: PKD domain-containing protein [Methanomicrobiales archaeon]|nr:PKD domain-containing protein [Methanomicrobiales archaeon]
MHRLISILLAVVICSLTVGAVQAQGQLYIESVPPGALMKLDGVNIGYTPVTTGLILAGNHTVNLSLEEYQDYSEIVNVEDLKIKRVQVTLTPIPPVSGCINVVSYPPGAEVYLQGDVIGTTPLQFCNLNSTKYGNYTVTLLLDGFDPWENTTVWVSPGQITNIRAFLVPSERTGNANFTSVPPGASIQVDYGSTEWKTEATIYYLSTGPHTYCLSLTGYENICGSFNVTARNTTVVPTAYFSALPLNGNIYINSEPTGATITVNGTVMGTTPSMLMLQANITGTKYNATISKGFPYKDWKGEIMVWGSQTVTFPTVYLEYRPEYSLCGEAGTGGKIEPAVCVEVYEGGEQCFEITPDTCYYIAQVAIDNIPQPLPDKTFNVTCLKSVSAGHTVNATFAKYQYNVTPCIGMMGGSISPSTTQVVSCGDDVSFTLSANLNYHITSYTVKGVVTQGPFPSPYTIVVPDVTKDTTICAAFTMDTRTITPCTTLVNGTISPSTPQEVPLGGTPSFTITAESGYSINNITIDGVNYNAGKCQSTFLYTFPPVAKNQTICADFKAFTLTPLDVKNGTISPSGPQKVPCGATFTFTITADTSYAINNLYINEEKNEVAKGKMTYDYTFSNVDKDYTIRADFYSYTITPCTTLQNGTISPSTPQKVIPGGNYWFTITAETGYSINNLYINGKVSTEAKGLQTYEYLFSSVNANHTICADVAINTYTVTPNAGPHGNITPSTSQVVPFKGSVSFNVTPDSCYLINQVTKDGVVQDVPDPSFYSTSFTNVQASHTLNATFTIKKFYIDVTAGTHGSIEPDGKVEVNCGSSVTFTVASDPGYYIYPILVDGTQAKPSSLTKTNVTFNGVNANHNLSANFILPPDAQFTKSKAIGTAPLTVCFNNTSKNPYTGWAWDFGDGTLSIEKNPCHTFQSVGTYNVTLTVINTNLNSMTDSVTQKVTVVKTPVADFTAYPTSGIAPLFVQFTDTSDGKPVKWLWNFGDGVISSQKSPYHVYSKAGSYNVSLTVTNTAGSNTLARKYYIKVSEVPVPDFSSNKTSGNAPLTVKFYDKSTGYPTSFAWAFGDGTSSTQKEPEHTYTKAGTYTISLKASNTAGSGTNTKAGYIKVTDAVVASFTATPEKGYAPLSVNFKDTTVGKVVKYYWTFGDGGTSTRKNPAHIFEKAGNYTVCLTVQTSTANSKVCKTITVTEAKVADFSGEPVRGTMPLTVSFTDQSSGTPINWFWNFGDGPSGIGNFVDGVKNPVYTYQAPGTFSVSLTASYADGSTNTTKRTSYITVLSP